MSLSTIIDNGLDSMVPSGITSVSTNADIINIFKSKKNLSNAVMHQYYNIKKNVEYRSVGKESLFPLNPNYATKSNNPIYCGYSRQYFARIANINSLFRRVLNLAFQYNNEIRSRAYNRSIGLNLPVCGKLTGKCY